MQADHKRRKRNPLQQRHRTWMHTAAPSATFTLQQHARDLHMPAPLSSSPELQALIQQLIFAASLLQPEGQFW